MSAWIYLAAGGSLACVLALAIEFGTILQFCWDRKRVAPSRSRNRESRSRARLLLATFAGAVTASPIIAFLTNIASVTYETDQTAAYFFISFLVAAIAIAAGLIATWLERADEFDYWGFAPLLRDLKDSLDASGSLEPSQVEKFRQIASTLTTRSDRSSEWTLRSGRITFNWRHATESAAKSLPSHQVMQSLRESINCIDAWKYLFTRRRRYLTLPIVGLATTLGFALGFPSDFANPWSMVAAAATFLLFVPVAFFAARESLMSRLGWIAVDKYQELEVARVIESLASPNTHNLGTDHRSLGKRMRDAYAAFLR